MVWRSRGAGARRIVKVAFYERTATENAAKYLAPERSCDIWIAKSDFSSQGEHSFSDCLSGGKHQKRASRSANSLKKRKKMNFCTRSVARSKCRASKPEPRRYPPAQLRVAFAHASHTLFRRCLLRQVRAYKHHGFARNAGHGLVAGPRRDISAFSTATLFFPEAADAGDRPRAARRDRAGRRSARRHTRAGYGGGESRRRASKRAHGGLYSPCAASRMRLHADCRRRRMATFSATCAFTRLATRLERTRAGHGGTPAHAPRPRRYLKPPSFEHSLTSTRLPRVPPSFSPSTFHVFR